MKPKCANCADLIHHLKRILFIYVNGDKKDEAPVQEALALLWQVERENTQPNKSPPTKENP